MHHHQQHQAKRRKKRILHGTKTVTVVRGKLGYGFTISGQNPCMLSSIVAGSPADQAGLKPGDMLYFVNGLNVSRACHDDVVRMVGLSTGSLELQVAENCNSSDSSDDDYLPRNKSRYPNRVRQRNAPVERGGKACASNDGKRAQRSIPDDSDPSFSPASTDDIPWTKPVTTRLSKHDLHGADGSKQAKAGGAEGFAFSSVQKGPVVSTAKISSAAAVVKKVPPVSINSRHGRQLSFPQPQVLTERPQNLWRHSSGPAIPFHGSEIDEEEEAEAMPVVADSARAVVGYIGSIEMPSSHTRPHQRLQALRNAVRRLRVEKRVHTLVLMQVSSTGITLSNAVGKEVASYPANRIAFSGICPDDKHFFGLVTLGLPDDSSSQYGAEGNCPLSSSCHIFMIEPELSSHSAHMQQADIFQIRCTTHPQTRRCEEFPVSATSLILCIANLYRDGPPRQFDNEIVQSHAFADPRHPQRINSNSSSNGNNSNSDSGLGFGREDAPLEQNEQVCVVDLPNSNSSASSAATIDTSGMSVAHHLSPEAFGCGTPRPPHSAQRPLSTSYDIRRGLNNSTSSEECWQSNQAALNKLTPRAMPDPSHKLRSRSAVDLTPTSVTMDDMRQSMQRLLQARQRQLQEQNQHLESDRDSAVGNPVLSLSVAENGQAILEGGQSLDHVFAVPSELPPGSSHHHHHPASTSTVRSAFQVPRPVSAPLSRQKTPTLGQPEMVDLDTMGKLSPRAFPDAAVSPPSAFRSPSAPPAPFFPHRESDEDDDDEDEDEVENEADPYIRQILDQFRRDRAVKKTEDNRRFSEGFAIMQKREKEKYEAGNLQKWSKSSSLKRGQPPSTMLKQSFSQSHESLAVHDEEPPAPTTHRLVTASSVNNVTRQTDQDEANSLVNKPGRVAGWAVNFDKLLQDPVGLAVFTSFLKKEFSEENVIFWTACEQYRKISDEQHRNAQAQEIYGRHLSAKASDPVNVDSAAKLYTEKFLDHPTVIMFDVAQQQIFQLMRQDSYSRFLKSEVYKGYLVKEIEGKPLIDPSTGKPESTGTSTGKADKKKGKGKENDEKRRRSILPWRQHKKSSLKSTSDPELKKVGKRSKEEKDKDNKEPNNNNSNTNNVSNEDSSNLKVVIADASNGPIPAAVVGQRKKVAGPGIDLSTMRQEVFHPKDKEVRDAPESQFKFCRIMLPDGSTTVVCAKPGQTCRAVLGKLCEKRSIALASVEVFLHGSSKPLDLEEDISVLGSKEIIIEKRVLFRLDMPNVKSIGVKAKPNRSVSEVFRPILHKYGFSLDAITVYVTGSQEPVNLDESVSCLDKQRATITTLDSAESLEPGHLPLSARLTKNTGTTTGKSKNNALVSARGGAGGGSLEEITNQIFDDLMRGKSQLAHGFDELGVVELDKAKVNKNEEGRSLGLFGLLRKESWGAKDRRPKGKGKVTFTLPGNDAKKRKEKDGEKLIRLLSEAQDLRMEDQRGIGVSTGEMPSFLNQDVKDTRGNSSSKHQPHAQHPGVLEVHMEEEEPSADTRTAAGLERMMEGDLRRARSPIKGRKLQHQNQMVTTPRGGPPNAWGLSSPTAGTTTITTTNTGTSTTTTPQGAFMSSEKWNHHNKSFGPDSIIPSPNTASAYFQMSPEIIEMHRRSVNNHSPHHNNHSPHHNNHSPHHNTQSPHHNNHSPHHNNHSPHQNNQSPHQNNYSPHQNNQSPHQNNHSPHQNNQSPHQNTQSPHHNTQSPHHNTQSPHHNNHSPHHNNQSPHHNTQSPHHNTQSPHHNNQSPHSNSYSPHNNSHSPHSLNPSPKTVPSRHSPGGHYNDPAPFKPTPAPQDSFQSAYSSFYAPVASPEKFSPSSAQAPAPPAMMILPSKMSPASPSSNSSSSSSSSIRRHPSYLSHQQQQQPPPQNISRMSDGMLLHKLQKARRSNASPNKNNPLSSSQHFHDHRNKTSSGADLAQRALLSPRFNDNEESHHHLDMTHAQRALLSPRLNHPFPNANMAHYYDTSAKLSPDYYNNRRSSPSPVRNKSSSSPFNKPKTTSSVEPHFGEPRPVSSTAGPQFSNWQNNKSFLFNTGQLDSPYHSPVSKQGTFKTDYLQEAGETVTFV